jgi:ABC-2 type transport system permease protein
MRLIWINEWKNLVRNKAFLGVIALFILSLALVSWMVSMQNQRLQAQREAANKQMREKWDNMDPMNPHGAAHYGTYVFKPITHLNSIDEGVNAVTGHALFLEGHVQNEIVYSEASQSLAISKFGKLKPSLILQFIIPLLLIFLSFNMMSTERESGRLKLLILQGAHTTTILWAKILAVWSLSLIFLVLTFGLIYSFQSSQESDILVRALLLIIVYALYYFIVSALTVMLSARLQNATAALSTMLAFWILWTLFLPKIIGSSMEKIYPLPSRQEFTAAMREDRAQGLDGHNPSDEREKEFKERILAEYGVGEVDDLPINLDGLIMQEDEEYGNMVWDKHFGKLNETFIKQKAIYQWSGLINPFASLQSVGMGLSGSDMIHHLDFLQNAEEYRRLFIKALNDEHAFGGSKTGDWSFKAEQEFFRSIEDFQYQSPRMAEIWSYYQTDLFLLSLWTLLILVGVPRVANKMQVI